MQKAPAKKFTKSHFKRNKQNIDERKGIGENTQ
jgi:hypothetical protein